MRAREQNTDLYMANSIFHSVAAIIREERRKGPYTDPYLSSCATWGTASEHVALDSHFSVQPTLLNPIWSKVRKTDASSVRPGQAKGRAEGKEGFAKFPIRTRTTEILSNERQSSTRPRFKSASFVFPRSPPPA